MGWSDIAVTERYIDNAKLKPHLSCYCNICYAYISIKGVDGEGRSFGLGGQQSTNVTNIGGCEWYGCSAVAVAECNVDNAMLKPLTLLQ